MGRAIPKRDRSAGFVCYCDDLVSLQRQWLLLDHGGHWDLPKGHVEPGETDLAAATRELLEETSLRPIEVIADFVQSISYYFRSPRKGLVFKTVAFFLARVGNDPVRISDEHVGYEFLPFHDAMDRLTYAATREVLRCAASRVERGVIPA